MSSSPTDTRLREAAQAARQAAQRLEGARPDIDQLVGRRARRRWLRTGAGAMVGLAAAAALTVIVVNRLPSSPTPEILGDATAPASPQPDSDRPEASDDGSAVSEERWVGAAPAGRSMAGDIDWEFFVRDTDRGLCVGIHYSGAISGTGESCGVDAGLAEGEPFSRIDKSADIFHELGVSFVYGLVPPSTSKVILSLDDGSTATVETIGGFAPEINARGYVLEIDRITRAQMGIALDSAGQVILQETFEVFAPPANP